MLLNFNGHIAYRNTTRCVLVINKFLLFDPGIKEPHISEYDVIL